KTNLEFAGFSPAVISRDAVSSELKPETKLHVARQVRLRVGKQAIGGGGRVCAKAAQVVAVGNVKCRSAELKRPPLAADIENLAQRQVLAHLDGIAYPGDDRACGPENSVGRLNKCRFVEIRTVRILRIPGGVIQRLAGNIVASRDAGSKQVLSATDAHRGAALITLHGPDPPAA